MDVHPQEKKHLKVLIHSQIFRCFFGWDFQRFAQLFELGWLSLLFFRSQRGGATVLNCCSAIAYFGATMCKAAVLLWPALLTLLRWTRRNRGNRKNCNEGCPLAKGLPLISVLSKTQHLGAGCALQVRKATKERTFCLLYLICSIRSFSIGWWLFMLQNARWKPPLIRVLSTRPPQFSFRCWTTFSGPRCLSIFTFGACSLLSACTWLKKRAFQDFSNTFHFQSLENNGRCD